MRENFNTKVTLITNGTLLNEKNVKVKKGLHMIDISTDAALMKLIKKLELGEI